MKDKIALDQKAYKAAEKLRGMWGIEEVPIDDLESLVVAKGFFMLKFPNNNEISGAYIEKRGREQVYKCIYMNTAEPLGRLNFTLAHELYHSYFEKSGKGMEVCSSKNFSKDPIEKTAEMFASYLLIPRKILVEELMRMNIVNNKYISFNEIIELQCIFKVSFSAMMMALTSLKNTPYYNYVPGNLRSFAKYYNKSYWEELKNKSEKKGVDLNTCNYVFELNESYKKNINKNINNNLIKEEDVKDIAEMFDLDLSSKEDK